MLTMPSFKKSLTVEQFQGNYLKMAKHSFQVPMPISPSLLIYLCFGALFLQESRLTIASYADSLWARHAGRLRDEPKECLRRRLG